MDGMEDSKSDVQAESEEQIEKAVKEGAIEETPAEAEDVDAVQPEQISEATMETELANPVAEEVLLIDFFIRHVE